MYNKNVKQTKQLNRKGEKAMQVATRTRTEKTLMRVLYPSTEGNSNKGDVIIIESHKISDVIYNLSSGKKYTATDETCVITGKDRLTADEKTEASLFGLGQFA